VTGWAWPKSSDGPDLTAPFGIGETLDMDESVYRRALARFRIFPPWLEIVLATALLASGLFGSHELWRSGHVEPHILALGLFGLVGIGNGVVRALAKSRLTTQLNILRLRESEICSTLARLRRENRGGRAWLHSAGITDSSLCDYLLAVAEGFNEKH
jgi:hypothetical protein